MNELRLPRVEKSLCGCSLELAAKIVAYFHVFGVVGATFVSFAAVESYNKPRDYNGRHSYEYLFFRNFLMLAAVVNMLAVAGAYLYGIRKKDKLFMEPLLITKGAFIMVDLFDFGLTIVGRTFFLYKSIDIFFDLFSLGLDSYMFTIIYSFYLQVRERVYSSSSREENI